MKDAKKMVEKPILKREDHRDAMGESTCSGQVYSVCGAATSYTGGDHVCGFTTHNVCYNNVNMR